MECHVVHGYIDFNRSRRINLSSVHMHNKILLSQMNAYVGECSASHQAYLPAPLSQKIRKLWIIMEARHSMIIVHVDHCRRAAHSTIDSLDSMSEHSQDHSMRNSVEIVPICKVTTRDFTPFVVFHLVVKPYFPSTIACSCQRSHDGMTLGPPFNSSQNPEVTLSTIESEGRRRGRSPHSR